MANRNKKEVSPLRVCFLLESFFPVMGGTETQARILAEDLLANGIRVLIVTRRSDRSFKPREDLGGIKIFRVPPAGKGHLTKWGLLFCCLPRLIRSVNEYDVIFVPSFRVLGIAAVLVSQVFRKGCVLRAANNGEMSGQFFEKGLKDFHLKPSQFPIGMLISIRNKILTHGQSFISTSSDIMEEFINNGVKKEKIHRIPNGVDTKKFCHVSEKEKNLLREKLLIQRGVNVFIFTGRLISCKGLPLLLKVWKDILTEYSNVILIIVGSGGSDMYNCEDEIKEYVKSNGLNERVNFTGGVTNVHEYLKASDVFVFPSEKEAFSNSLIEAMACGLPVISTSTGGAKDIIVHKENGYMVEPGDFNQLREAISILINDRGLQVKLGMGASRTIQEKYSRQVIANRCINLFNQSFNG